MARVDTLNEEYKRRDALSGLKNDVMIASVIATFTGIWTSDCLLYQIVLAALIITNLILTVLWEVINNQLEDKRIVNAVEVGFGKTINSDVETDGFYNNNSKPGVRKLAINLCESLFFTYHIYKENLRKRLLTLVASTVVVILCIVFMNGVLAVTIVEVIFGMNVLYDLFKQSYCFILLSKLYKDMDHCIVSDSVVTADLLAIAFKYEKLKSYSSLQTSRDIYLKLNPKLSESWEEYLKKNNLWR